jgi:hypothetical protein
VSGQALAKPCKKWVVNVSHAEEDCQAGPPPVGTSLLHLAHSLRSVYSTLYGIDHHCHTASRDEAAIAIMVLFRDTRRFEITVEEQASLWVAKLQAFIPGRLYPTLYLLQTWTTRQEAIEALQRKWRVLFPDEEALAWHDPVPVSLPSPPRRPPHSEGHAG